MKMRNEARREDILRAIRAHQGINGPTVRELAGTIGVSLSTMHGYIDRMSADGSLRIINRRGGHPLRFEAP